MVMSPDRELLARQDLENYSDFHKKSNFSATIVDYFNKYDSFSQLWIADCVQKIKEIYNLSNDMSLGEEQRIDFKQRGIVMGYYIKQNFLIYYTVTSYLIKDQMFLPLTHLLPLFEQMSKVLDGDVTHRISIINIFSGAGKTSMTNRICTYEYARNPDSVILHVSASDGMLRQNAEDIRQVCGSEYFEFLFGYRLNPKDRSKYTQWKFRDSTKPYNYMAKTYGSAFLGASAGGTEESRIKKGLRSFTDGKGDLDDALASILGEDDLEELETIGGLLLLDDPQEEGNADSEYEKDFLDFTGKVMSRARGNTNIVVNQQRVHYNDLSGCIMRYLDGLWTVVKVPVFDENGILMQDCNNPKKIEKELRAKQRATPRNFACMYMQEPLVEDGDFFKRTDFYKFEKRDMEGKQFDRLFITCDTAFTVKSTSDYTVMGLFGMMGKNLYMLEMVRGKYAGLSLADKLTDTWNDWALDYGMHIPFYIEYISSGIIVYDILEGRHLPVKEIDMGTIFKTGTKVKPPKGKAGRVAAVQQYYQKNGVYVDSRFYDDVVDECTQFREDEKHAHDDIVDVLTYGVAIGYNGKGKQFMTAAHINKINENIGKWMRQK